MKKSNNQSEKRLQKKRERKKLKRRKKRHTGTPAYEKELRTKIDIDQKVIGQHNFLFDEFLSQNTKGNHVNFTLGLVKIPSDFMLETNQKGVFDKIKEIRSNFKSFTLEKITLDFTNCKKVDFSSLFLLRTIIVEYLGDLGKLDKRLSALKVRPKISVIDSKTPNVSVQLLACSFIPTTTEHLKEPDLLPVTALHYLKGSKRQDGYLENKKGTVATSIRRYINRCLREHDMQLTPEEEGDFDGIISEALNNAEDHSLFDTWYTFGNFFKSKNHHGDFVGEVNLAILNFGYSIYDGILETKDQNTGQYASIRAIYEAIRKNDRRKNFTEENIFTLASLQDGISRLKHEDNSRGTGTMTFIQSFMELGDYESTKDGFHPSLMIYSGHSIVKCDLKYRPFYKNNRAYISLNNSKNIADLPDKKNLWSSPNRFPGTLLVVKLYLNEKHLHKKFTHGGG